MRLISDRAVVDAAVRVEDTIVATYLEPNRFLPDMMDIVQKEGGINFLTESVRQAGKTWQPASGDDRHLVEGVLYDAFGIEGRHLAT